LPDRREFVLKAAGAPSVARTLRQEAIWRTRGVSGVPVVTTPFRRFFRRSWSIERPANRQPAAKPSAGRGKSAGTSTCAGRAVHSAAPAWHNSAKPVGSEIYVARDYAATGRLGRPVAAAVPPGWSTHLRAFGTVQNRAAGCFAAEKNER